MSVFHTKNGAQTAGAQMSRHQNACTQMSHTPFKALTMYIVQGK